MRATAGSILVQIRAASAPAAEDSGPECWVGCAHPEPPEPAPGLLSCPKLNWQPIGGENPRCY